MAAQAHRTEADRNIRLYPWFKLSQSLTFSQAIWFLYFQNILSPAEAILLYVVADLTTTLLEVPSGYASDRFGRRLTLILVAARLPIERHAVGRLRRRGLPVQ